MSERGKTLAVCGLICDEQHCDIFQASSHPEVARKIADWFKQERDEEVNPEAIRCSGCKGDRDEHWSPDCWILQCCVDGKGLEFCCQCQDFPCARLEGWAGEDERYGKALDRLKDMRL